MTIEQYITKLSELMGEQITYAEHYDTYFEEAVYLISKQQGHGGQVGISKVKLLRTPAHSFDMLEHMKQVMKLL
jgi:hypothetical protein